MNPGYRERARKGGTPLVSVPADRGFDTPCLIAPHGVSQWAAAINWLEEQVGVRGDHEIYQHLCERYGEPNRCINPTHIVIGTKSTNARHFHELRARAGVKWAGGRQVGDRFEKKTCDTCGKSYRYVGAHKDCSGVLR